MINIFIFLTSFLAGFVFYLLKRINDLQQQIILLDKEQHEQNKEMLEMFEFKIQQAKLNVAVVEVFALEPLFATKTISIEAGPCVAGFHEQVATNDPLVDLFRHPGITLPRS